jgi:pteridine reductase
MSNNHQKSALITGGATRIGAAICQALHDAGYVIFMHYGQSHEQANALQQELNTKRENSCFIFSQDLSAEDAVDNIINWVTPQTQSLTLLVNNASVFFPTPWSQATTDQWQSIFHINAQVPMFLSQACLPLLQKHAASSIINLIDIHAQRSLEDHPIYSASKAALTSLTQSFAKDLGRNVRCNGISPGAILWPEQDLDSQAKHSILNKVPMGTLGAIDNITQTVLFLAQNNYVNGQVINVDGGRTVFS